VSETYTTPEFVRWTLAYDCALRDETDVTDPEQAERQLRSLRELSIARAEGRVLRGVCLASDALVQSDLAQARGFLESEVLAAYGGESLVTSRCAACPANVLPGEVVRQRFAGCFGLLILESPLVERLEAAIEQVRRSDIERFDTVFLASQPRRYGIWATPLEVPQIAILAEVFQQLQLDAPSRDVAEFQRALQLAQANHLALHARLYPTGMVQSFAWTVASHCPRCRAPMAMTAHCCPACRFVGRALPGKKRKPRGQRPYVPLARFLGEQAARDLLASAK
jgi:hypothetical protein